MSQGSEAEKEYVLERESELRLEVASSPVSVLLLSGTVEVFGTELAKRRPYEFQSGAKVAFFTWHGCTLKLMGSPEVAYISRETPMVLYLNTHIAVDQIRHRASREGKMGPRVVIAGSVDVGKSTMCRLLLNYAIRMNRRLCYVETDVGQGSLCIPGTMGITPIEGPADPVEGFSNIQPMIFHYGHNSPSPNVKLFINIINRLAAVFEKKCEVNEKFRVGGCVINTCGWVDGQGYKTLVEVCKAFKADAVLVLDNERLLNQLEHDLPQEARILLLPKSAGVVSRSRTVRRATREEKIREYFYGKKGLLSYFPFTFDVKFSDVKIYKIGAPVVPDSCLPIGATKEDGSTTLLPVQPDKELVNSLASVSMATSSEDDVINHNSAGFVCIMTVDMEQETMSVLSPAPGPLPRKILLLSEVKFVDIR
ncbi:polyribonucleotide 5'-hydroxyl-kinase Clp1-like [Dysidea avara]|uniref:polyribonucleotide 5'-hydroxyl-kinase Clp1-like n=1 Tax=Dysidea avara TaxID=196820 RepID=UPI00332722FB